MLIQTLQDGLAATGLAGAQAGTIRVALLKVAARVIERVRVVRVHSADELPAAGGVAAADVVAAERAGAPAGRVPLGRGVRLPVRYERKRAHGGRTCRHAWPEAESGSKSAGRGRDRSVPPILGSFERR